MANKNPTIETLRGFAILLVVMGHVIGSAPDGGMQIDFPSPWRYLYLWIDYIQMPLFTAIAGWVYALRPPARRPLGDFTWSKFKRLIVPMIVVASLYYLTRHFTPGTNMTDELRDIWRILLFPYGIFWYLQSLFLIFVAIYFIDRFSMADSLKSWGIVLCVALVLYVCQIVFIRNTVPNIFSFEGALNQLPYFLAGLGIKRFSDGLYNPKTKAPLMALALVGLVLLQFRWFDPITLNTLYQCMLPLWIISTLILLINQPFKSRLFIFFGTYAYSIYLLHGFGTAGGRIVLHGMGVSNQVLVFTLALLVAIFVPILVDRVLTKNKTLSALVLGKQIRK